MPPEAAAEDSNKFSDWAARRFGPHENSSGVSLLRNTPELCGLVTLFLELEPSSQLNLPLAEKSAVSAGNAVEARGATAKVQQWARVGQGSGRTDGINPCAHTCHLRAIKEIESLGQQLKLHLLS